MLNNIGKSYNTKFNAKFPITNPCVDASTFEAKFENDIASAKKM